MTNAGITLKGREEEVRNDTWASSVKASDEILLMPTSAFERIAEAIDSCLGKEADRFWYELGEETGAKIAEALIAKTKSKRARVFKLLIEETQSMGWGKITIHDKKFGGIEGIFRFEVAALLRNHSGSRCQLLRGYLAGSLRRTYDIDDLTCVEIEGEGDGFCEFKVDRPRKSLLRSIFF